MNEQAKLRYLKDIEYFSVKLGKDPKSKVFMPLALAFLKLGKYDEVIEVCQKGLDFHPGYLGAKTIMAQAFLEKGMIDEAKGLLIEVATLNKSNYRANKLLGEIYRSEENIEKAIYYYRTALQISPEDKELKNLVEELATLTDSSPLNIEEIEEIEEKQNKDISGLSEDEMLEQASELSDEIDTELLTEDDEQVVKDDVESEPDLEDEQIHEVVIPDEEDDEGEDYFDTDTDNLDLDLDITEAVEDEELDLFNDELKLDEDEVQPENSADSSILNELDLEDKVSDDSQESLFDLDVEEENLDFEDKDSDGLQESLFDFDIEEDKLLEDNIEVKNDQDNNDTSIQEIDNFDDIVDKKIESAISDSETVEASENTDIGVNKEAVEKLESWLKNIKGVKSSRNVY